MLRSPILVTWLAMVMLAGGCARGASDGARAAQAGGDSQPAAGITSTRQPASGAQQFQAIAPVERLRHGPPVTVTGVVAEEPPQAGAGYDRVVFQFADSAAGYRVAYADQPVRRCGSGDLVSLQGSAVLLVRLQPAQAHDAGGRAVLAPREMAPGLPAVKEMKLICDFEGQVQWALGVEGRLGFRVSELAGPARLVIDVEHPR